MNKLTLGVTKLKTTTFAVSSGKRRFFVRLGHETTEQALGDNRLVGTPWSRQDSLLDSPEFRRSQLNTEV